MKGEIDSTIKEKDEEMMILGGDFNARIVAMGEETENTNRRKSKVVIFHFALIIETTLEQGIATELECLFTILRTMIVTSPNKGLYFSSQQSQ